MEEIVCPKCNCNQLSSDQNGVTSTNASLGMLSVGMMHGFASMIRSNKIVITCLNCGHQFKAGDGAIKITDENGNVTIEKQVHVDKNKILIRRKVVFCTTLLILIAICIFVLFNYIL